jgi:hypothetical protein
MKLMLHGGFRCYPCPSLLVIPLGLSRHPIRPLASTLKFRVLVLSLGVCSHDRKIAGQASFRTLSGPNTPTSFRALRLLSVVAPR